MSWVADISKEAMKVAQGYEEKEGRKPEDFSHKGVGYDIHSKNDSEERYIEVKGVSERWNTYTWQSLNHKQYDVLKENKDKFWLYVIRFEIPEEERISLTLIKTNPDIYVIPGKDLLDKSKFRIEEESYSLKSALGTNFKKRLENYKI